MDITENQRLRELQKILKFSTQSAFSEVLGIKQGSLSDIYRAKTGLGVSNSIKRILQEKYNVNIEWLEKGSGNPISKNLVESSMIENNNGNSFMPLPNGKYLMHLPLLSIEAQAGFAENSGDIDYWDEIDELHSVIVPEIYKGRYVAFRVRGDSMDDGSYNSIQRGSIVTTRELNVVHWKDKLRYKKFPYWIIGHIGSTYPLLKQIVAHDTEKAIIKCHSLNESIEYSDFELRLNDVTSLFYVVSVSKDINQDNYF